MKTKCLRALLLAACMLLATTGVALAHVRVLPEEVPADSFEVFTVRVPSEKDVPTTGVRVEVPEGFVVSRVEPVPGWEYELEEEAGVVTAINWSGGEIGETEFRQFGVQGKTPEEPGDYPWRAFQTYEDGSVVEWVGSGDAEEPASVMRVAGGGAEGSQSSEATLGVGTFTPVAAYSGLGAGALALVLATLALLRGSRNKA